MISRQRRRPLLVWMLHSLRGRLMLLMLVAALPAFALLLYTAFWLREQGIAHTEAHLQNQARVLAVEYQHHVDEARRFLAGLAKFGSLPEIRSQDCDVLLKDVLRQAPAYIANFSVVNPAGDILCSALGQSRLTRIADRSHFQRALNTDGFGGGDYIVSRITGEPVVMFTHTLRRDNAVSAVLTATLDLSWVRRHPQFAELPPGAAYALYDHDGTLLLHHPDDSAAPVPEVAGTPFWQALSSQRGPGTFRSRDADNIERLYGYAPLNAGKQALAHLVVSLPVAAAHAQADAILKFILLGLAIASGLGLLIGWAGGWALVIRPMQPIFDTVRRVASGDFDARTGSRAGHTNEIQRLATEVDHMAAALARINHERQQAEQAMRQERDRAQAYLDIVGVMVLALDREGRIMLTNRKVCEVLGCCEDGVCLASDWFGCFLPEEKREAARTAFGRLMAGERSPPKYHEDELLTCAGQRRLIAWHNTVLHDADGGIVGTLSAGEDITERRRSEEELRATQQMLRLVTDTIPHHVFWKDRNSVFLGCNSAFAVSAGVGSPEHIVGKTDHDLVWRQQAELYRRDDAKIMASGLPQLNYIEPQSLADGSRIWLETSKLPLRDGSERVIGVLGMYRDITERKELEDERERLQRQLQQAQKMEALGQLTGGIAHDFNNILASVLGFSKLALKRHVPDPNGPLAEYLREVIAAGERARDLVAKMLAFSRTRPSDEVPVVAPYPLVKEALRMLASTIPASIRIDCCGDGDLPDVAIDPVDLNQILMNLIINARDATNGKGRIDVHLYRAFLTRVACADCHQEISGDYVVLSVADDGEGIPPNVLPRIFDPFFTTKEVGKGTGMGLAVVHSLLAGCHGHVLIESRPGEGSVFRILLPIATADARPPVVATDLPAEPAAPARGRVLVVDDEAPIRFLLSESLRAAGWSVSDFAEPRHALASFREQPQAWDAVITDEAMPEMTGAELSVALHALRPDLPVILCTGYSDYLDEAQALALGICRFFHKPVDIEVLLASLSEVVDASR